MGQCVHADIYMCVCVSLLGYVCVDSTNQYWSQFKLIFVVVHVWAVLLQYQWPLVVLNTQLVLGLTFLCLHLKPLSAMAHSSVACVRVSKADRDYKQSKAAC